MDHLCKTVPKLVLSIRDSEYIRAAKICGAGPTAIIFKYILPNMVSPLIVTAALDVSSFILSMAGLSFLGLGPSRPTAEWGATMSEAKTFIQQAHGVLYFRGWRCWLQLLYSIYWEMHFVM